MANNENTFENADFDDILDEWQSTRKHGYRWEGETGVRNFEALVQNIGYEEGIEQFLADNPGAIENLLEWISEFAEKEGSEWKENLAKACDYEPEDNTTSDNGTEIAELIATARTFNPTPTQQEIIDQIELELKADDAQSEEEQLNWEDQAGHQLRMLIYNMRAAAINQAKSSDAITKKTIDTLEAFGL